MKPEDIRTTTLEELAVLEGDLRRQLDRAAPLEQGRLESVDVHDRRARLHHAIGDERLDAQVEGAQALG